MSRRHAVGCGSVARGAAPAASGSPVHFKFKSVDYVRCTTPCTLCSCPLCCVHIPASGPVGPPCVDLRNLRLLLARTLSSLSYSVSVQLLPLYLLLMIQ